MPHDLDLLAARLLENRKYRDLGLPPETLYDLLRRELAAAGAGDPPYDPRRRPVRQALDGVRARLHNIVATYLGDPDYAQAQQDLSAAYAPGAPEDLRSETLRRLLGEHASSRERLPVLETLYPQLWAVTGLPHSLLDLACALHPLGLPWMGLPAGASYRAFDLHQPRLDLLNHFFTLASPRMDAAAEQRDILVDPPRQAADVALILKEVHRFEQRRPGCSAELLGALQLAGVRWALVSLPESSLPGAPRAGSRRQTDLGTGYRRMLFKALTSAGLPEPSSELTTAGEMFFFIRLNP